VLEGAQRACWGFGFAEWLDVPIRPSLLVLGEGRGPVGFLKGPQVAIEIDGQKHSLDGIRFDVDHH